jgi:hypothetical protein
MVVSRDERDEGGSLCLQEERKSLCRGLFLQDQGKAVEDPVTLVGQCLGGEEDG